MYGHTDALQSRLKAKPHLLNMADKYGIALRCTKRPYGHSSNPTRNECGSKRMRLRGDSIASRRYFYTCIHTTYIHA